jgi:hypothetical protein
LAVQTAREVAVRALRGKVSAPAKFVEAALAGVGRAPSTPKPAAGRREGGPPYRATGQGLVWLKPTREGEVPIALANFTARIVGEVVRDDGAELMRSFEVEAQHRGRDHRFEVGAAKFFTMSWVVEALGATAIVEPGLGTRDHARAAIQHLSDEVQVRTVYAHTGWRRVGDQWLYLHAGGALGPMGPVLEVETDLPAKLRPFHLPAPPCGDDLRGAVHASLGLLSILPEVVSLPVYCAIWRSVLGPCDFSEHLVGQTGEGKTELAALAEQHFGPGLDARNLPGSWTSTGNSLEVLAFTAKDALLVVDDFAPEGSAYDVQRQHRETARVFRAQGNRSGRNRLRPDGTLRSVKEPRGLILSTGEDVPKGHSVRARTLILEVPVGGMDWEALTHCQRDAAAGLYAQAMAAFLQWMAARFPEIQELRRKRTGELRAQATASKGQHRRTPSIVAELAYGMELFLRFGREVGALSEAEALDLWERTWRALGQAAAAQAEHLGAAEPVRRFLELLASAIVAGRAHVASPEESEPERPEMWGWRERTIGVGEHARPELQPQGDRVGWVRGGDLYLDGDSAYRVAQLMGGAEAVTVGPRTVWKRMKEQGLLVTVDEARQRNLARVWLGGVRREVVHLRAETLIRQKPSLPSPTAPEARETALLGPILGAGSGCEAARPAPETGPTEPENPALPGGSGPMGTVGTVSGGRGPAPDEGWVDP